MLLFLSFFHVFFLLSFSSSFFPLLLVFLSFTHLCFTQNLILYLLEHYIMQNYMKFGANLLRRNRPSNNVLKRKMDPVLYANRFKVPEVQPLKYKKGDELPFAVYWLYACLGWSNYVSIGLQNKIVQWIACLFWYLT